MILSYNVNNKSTKHRVQISIKNVLTADGRMLFKTGGMGV